MKLFNKMQDSFSFNFILKNKPAPADEFRKIQQPQRSVRIPIPRTSFLKSKTCVFYEEEKKKNVRLKKLFFYTFSDINFSSGHTRVTALPNV